MGTHAGAWAHPHVRYGGRLVHRVDVVVPRSVAHNRWTSVLRPILAIPHLILVGAPAALLLSLTARANEPPHLVWGLSTGVLGGAAAIVACSAWVSILATGRYPEPLRAFAAFYLRWRVRAAAYITLLRDEYPPFGDETYPAVLMLLPPTAARDRVSVALRLPLALPHVACVWFLGLAWAMTTLAGMITIVVTGRFPEPLHRFGVGVLRWTTRVEAYLLLLDDEYPPFSLESGND